MTHYRARISRLRPASRTQASGALESAAWVVGAAIITAIAAQISITLPGVPVPFTMQPVAVLTAGLVLGARRGALSQLTYLALGIAGTSAFAWSPALLPGIARLAGPTGGFLLAFPLSAFVAGFLADRGWNRGAGAFVALLAGAVPLYAVGVAWASLLLPTASLATWLPFAAADVVKLALAAPLAGEVRRVYAR